MNPLYQTEQFAQAIGLAFTLVEITPQDQNSVTHGRILIWTPEHLFEWLNIRWHL
ncbi:hypothetical protein BH10CHL1_BH10CHL1_42170 [soil metagenome]